MAAIPRERYPELAQLWHQGMRVVALAEHFGVSQNVIKGLTTRLNLHAAPHPETIRRLPANHPAAVDGRSLFPSTVRSPNYQLHRGVGDVSPHVLVSGRNQRKLGMIVQKGPWRGMPIFSLSLEERATCPRSCVHWQTCYGDAIYRATRYRHGRRLEETIERELNDLQRRYPGGFVVRLHQLGDFYSVAYVALWNFWLDQFPALHVFGYTARPLDSKIGEAVSWISATRWDRFAVRLSDRSPGPQRAVTIWTQPEANKVPGIVCPAQTGRTLACSTCGLCWSPNARHRTILFIAHGRR